MTDAERTISEHLDTCDHDECCLDKHRDEIERLRRQVERVEHAIEAEWGYAPDVGVPLHRLRVALDG